MKKLTTLLCSSAFVFCLMNTANASQAEDMQQAFNFIAFSEAVISQSANQDAETVYSSMRDELLTAFDKPLSLLKSDTTRSLIGVEMTQSACLAVERISKYKRIAQANLIHKTMSALTQNATFNQIYEQVPQQTGCIENYDVMYF